MSLTRRSSEISETHDAGPLFATWLAPRDIVVVSGPLGAGKTALTQGVARGLGVRDRVTSPTFTLVREHECDNTAGITHLHHADLYRTNSLDEIEDLVFEELVEPSGVAVIEWGEMGDGLWPVGVWRVEIRVIDDELRDIIIHETPPGRDVTGWDAL